MSKDKINNNNNGLSDASFWRLMTKDVQKLPGKEYLTPAEPSKKPQKAVSERVIVPQNPDLPSKPRLGQDLDRRTEERLRKGQMAIEATLDLHGMNQADAHGALNAFIRTAHARGQRCVLVITGKGRSKGRTQVDQDWMSPEPGVLKRRTPEWLSAVDMRPYILKFVPAKQKDGGEGALYVYLRRIR